MKDDIISFSSPYNIGKINNFKPSAFALRVSNKEVMKIDMDGTLHLSDAGEAVDWLKDMWLKSVGDPMKKQAARIVELEAKIKELESRL